MLIVPPTFEDQCQNSSNEESDLMEVTQFHVCYVNETLFQKNYKKR